MLEGLTPWVPPLAGSKQTSQGRRSLTQSLSTGPSRVQSSGPRLAATLRALICSQVSGREECAAGGPWGACRRWRAGLGFAICVDTPG